MQVGCGQSLRYVNFARGARAYDSSAVPAAVRAR